MRTHAVILALAVAAAAACGRKSEMPKFARSDSPSTSSGPTSGDPCSLLDTTEVAAAIGPLVGPPFRGDFLTDRTSNVCRYETKDHRRLLLTVDWTMGPQMMHMVHFARNLTDKAMQGETKAGVTVLKTGDTLVGEWDEIAAAPVVCCALDVLRGEQHLKIDWTGLRLTPVAAAALLSAALKRIDHPLAIDGTLGIASAKERLAADAKDTLIDVCALVSQKDAEALIGTPLTGPPDHGEGKIDIGDCYYRTPMNGVVGSRIVLVYEVRLKEWHDAHATFMQDEAILHGLGSAANADTSSTQTPGPWDEEGVGPAGYEAVKGNLMLVAGTSGNQKKAEALLAKAIAAAP
jgi:hypothetical protein